MIHAENQPLLWIGFNVFVLLMLALDLFVFNREAHTIRLREAALWSALWIALSLLFAGGIYHFMGSQSALEFLAGWVIEKSLSVDNLFVFLLVLGQFKVPPENQHRVLFAGVVGALVMRVVFILAGTALVHRFHFVEYIFGAFLVFTALKMLFGKDEAERDLSDSRLLKLTRRFIPMTQEYVGSKFFVRREGKLLATPMLAVLVVIEATDVVFAVDSIPAVLGVSKDSFIVYSSNIFAILGLRALYFLLVGVLEKFRYLKFGLSAILAFVGVKMLISDYYKVPIGISLLVIFSTLAVTVLASIVGNRRAARLEAEAGANHP